MAWSQPYSMKLDAGQQAPLSVGTLEFAAIVRCLGPGPVFVDVASPTTIVSGHFALVQGPQVLLGGPAGCVVEVTYALP